MYVGGSVERDMHVAGLNLFNDPLPAVRRCHATDRLSTSTRSHIVRSKANREIEMSVEGIILHHGEAGGITFANLGIETEGVHRVYYTMLHSTEAKNREVI
jgi:hypothetical protein